VPGGNAGKPGRVVPSHQLAEHVGGPAVGERVAQDDAPPHVIGPDPHAAILGRDKVSTADEPLEKEPP
jgi:hypothetical protein